MDALNGNVSVNLDNHARAMAMQKACEAAPSTMAAIIALPDARIEEICAEVSREGHVVVPANYNCPGQLVISGNVDAINAACEKLKEAGAKRALPLKVGGAFHSPLMQPAKDELEAAIEKTTFNAAQLVNCGATGYMSSIRNLAKPSIQWIAGGIPITMMMNIERRHGVNKPVIRKALVDLEGRPFQEFEKNRAKWAKETCYIYPGPIQYFGPDEVCNVTSRTLYYEQKGK